MRAERTVQCRIFERYAEHEIDLELQAMSAWLDAYPELLAWVAGGLIPGAVQTTGRRGLTCESVLQCAILKQYRQLSDEELAFCLLDSISCQAFARLTTGRAPKKAALQGAISQISDSTWERINQHLLQQACLSRFERGDLLRIDSTVTDDPIHEPSDSTLLCDSVRVLVRLLNQPRCRRKIGFRSSIANLDATKARQVTDVVFHKKCGLSIEAKAKRHWVYRKLRNFRAGIEAGISCLKRAYGLRGFTWKGLAHFKAYVCSSVAAHNLALLARLKPIPICVGV